MEANKIFYEIEILSDKKILVKDNQHKYQVLLSDRLMEFAANTISFLYTLPIYREFDVFRNQLSRSATSIGANYEESQASSYPEFKQRIQICLREAREANYWIRLLLKLINENIKLNRTFKGKSTDNLHKLQKESSEIVLIFGAISSKINKKLKQTSSSK